MKKMTELKGGVSCEGMTPEWVAREGKKGDTIIQARMQEAMGEVETALGLYAVAASEEEAVAEYCQSIGLEEKAFFHLVSGANLWGRTGNLYRAVQLSESLLSWETLKPKQRELVERTVERWRTKRRQWHALEQELQEAAGRQRSEAARSSEAVAA